MLKFFALAALIAVAFAMPTVQDDAKVNLVLAEESLCPDCQNFILGSFNDAFEAGLFDILNVQILPYGNAKLVNGSIVCQHGPNECQGNMMESCAIAHNPDAKAHFPFIHCMEQRGGYATAGKDCAQKAGLDYAPIEKCFSSQEGQNLQLQMAKLTPTHTYVPWVVLDGQVLDDSQQTNLISSICNAYKGTNKPKACEKTENEIKKRGCPADW